MKVSVYLIVPILLVITGLFVHLGSQWMDRLYAKRKEILTYPQDIDRRRKYRKWILGVLFFGCEFRLCMTLTEPIDFLLLLVIPLLLLMTLTDFEQYCLFDEMMIPLAVGGFLWCLLVPETAPNHGLAALAGGGVFFLLAVLSGGALGGGDVKLVAALGLWLGTEHLLSVVCLGMVFGGLAAGLLLLLKKKKRKSAFAYGPYFTLTTVALFLL